MKKLVIFGSGGLAQEVRQYICDINKIAPQYDILGYIDTDITSKGKIFNDVPVLGGNDTFLRLCENNDISVFCAIANPAIKKKVHKELYDLNITPINVVHPTAYISPSVTLGNNVLIAPSCVLTTNIFIGDYVIINPQCGIGHNSEINEYTTLYWSVNVGGFVKIGKECEIGSNTFIRQYINIGDNVVTGAGSVVVKNINSNNKVKGVPAMPY